MDNKYNLARNLRKNSTKQEDCLWKILRNRQFYGLKFKRQVPVGQYIADFLCYEKQIIVEVDGGQHNTPENIIADKQRTDFLNSKGFKIVRFWNNEIETNPEGVFEKLKLECNIKD